MVGEIIVPGGSKPSNDSLASLASLCSLSIVKCVQETYNQKENFGRPVIQQQDRRSIRKTKSRSKGARKAEGQASGEQTSQESTESRAGEHTRGEGEHGRGQERAGKGEKEAGATTGSPKNGVPEAYFLTNHRIVGLGQRSFYREA